MSDETQQPQSADRPTTAAIEPNVTAPESVLPETEGGPEASAASSTAKAPKAPKAKAAAPAADGAEAPAAAKKEKPPAIEDKPLPEFMAQDCLPALQQNLTTKGVAGIDLRFAKQKIAVKGYESSPECWQIIGHWQIDNQPRQFNVYFFDETLQGQRGFSYSSGGTLPSTMESFRIDERKLSIDLFISGVLQRLNGQKWLTRN
jgi:hypothetical protein